jgi:hypothetical protein
MTPLNNQQAAQSLRRVLAESRGGTAALVDLAEAYQTASGAGLHGTAAELRGHLLDKLGRGRSTLGRDIALGLGTGLLTHLLLGGR